MTRLQKVPKKFGRRRKDERKGMGRVEEVGMLDGNEVRRAGEAEGGIRSFVS